MQKIKDKLKRVDFTAEFRRMVLFFNGINLIISCRILMNILKEE